MNLAIAVLAGMMAMMTLMFCVVAGVAAVHPDRSRRADAVRVLREITALMRVLLRVR